MQLKVDNLKKHFGEKEILKGISFEVSEGAPLGLLGRNGAGKTTTIRTLMGIYPIEQGKILLNSNDFNPKKESIGYLPEERGLYQDIKVIDQLVYIGRLRGLSTAEAKRNGAKYLEKFKISDHLNSQIKTLSKGNQQKVQLAQTIVHDPKIVILDEPFSGLDPVNSDLLSDVIRQLIADNKIVIFSSHQMSYVEEFCKNVVIINKGEIVLKGHLDEIKQKRGENRLVLKANNYSPQQLIDKFANIFLTATILSDDELLITLTNISKNEFMKYLLNTDIDIHSIKMYEPSLHDIFVDTVGEG